MSQSSNSDAMLSLFSSSSFSSVGSGSSLKSKREDCKSTLHDSDFSKWEILIGSSDWEDHSLGKDGARLYRTHNLPKCSSCPGLYELGIAAVPTDVGRKSRRHDSQNIIVVYLGQTNDVRTRLQQYGRVGAHLESGKSVSCMNENECFGLLKEVFNRGYSIMFRWAPMIDKKKAEKTESERFAVYDYAWNKRGNGACRRDEILSKLDSKTATQVTIPRKLQPWKHPAFGRKAGINIDASVSLDDQKGLLLPSVLKFEKSQLRFIRGNNSLYEDHKICGVAIGNGLVCENRPIFGCKRCEEHKGKKIIETGPVLSRVIATTENTNACGIVLEDGSFCAELPAHGRKRCESHEGKRRTKLQLYDMHVGRVEIFDGNESPFRKCQLQSFKGVVEHEEEGYNICGVIYGDGTMCRNKPVLGRKRCVEHKGQKASVTELKLPTSRECWETIEDGVICGVVTDGYVCRKRPVSGRKRCEEHKGRRITAMLPGMSSEGLEEKTNVSACGVGLGNGSRCTRLPVPGRKRFELHKGRRAT